MLVHMQTCPSCGRANPDDARFCASCGMPLADAQPSREERKVVTVVFCDLVGSTARAERMDPEDVRALLSDFHDRVRSELERHGGAVEKFIGDAVVAVFGAPAAHEDDPSGRSVARLQYAIGRGRTEAPGPDRDHDRRGARIARRSPRPRRGHGVGNVVNTAARLQSAAPVGGILVDEATRRATERAIDYVKSPPVQAKGKEEPVAVWEPLEARSASAWTSARSPARSSSVGGASSRLCRPRSRASSRDASPSSSRSSAFRDRQVEARLRAPPARRGPKGARHLAPGRSLPYGDGASFWRSARWKAQTGILETDGPQQTEEKLRRMVTELAAGDDARWLERHLRPLVGLEADTAIADDRRDEAFAAWRRFFETLADLRVLVLVFEDLHFADEGLLDFVDHLVDRASGVPILAIGTARPEFPRGGRAGAVGSRAPSRFRCPHSLTRKPRSSCTSSSTAPCSRPASRRSCSSAPAATRSTRRSLLVWSATATRWRSRRSPRPCRA